MQLLPSYIGIVFILTTLLTLAFFFKATKFSLPVLLLLLAWLILQSFIAASEFYLNTKSIPPRFLLLILPPLLSIACLFFTVKGKKFISELDIKTLTWLHAIRIPVELVLFWLCLHKAVPELMTFEGRNFDILSGLSAPFALYFGFRKGKINRAFLLVWNIVCLALLLNIVINAILSAPFPFQQFAFDQPNIAVFYFPFFALPSVVVPIVLFSHLVSLKQLIQMHKN